MTDERPSWDSYFLGIAAAVAARADCTRRKVGAVLVGTDRRIIETGYNGAPPGFDGCLSSGACPRGRHYPVPQWEGDDEPGACAACRTEWPCPEAAEPSSSYDTGPGSCIALHAEANALLRAGIRAKGTTLYITDRPCDGCMRLVAGAQVAEAIWPGGSLGR